MAQIHDDTCASKARIRNDRTFTLVGQDLSSPRVIVEWIKENLATCPRAKLHQALDDALDMQDLPNRKHAD